MDQIWHDSKRDHDILAHILLCLSGRSSTSATASGTSNEQGMSDTYLITLPAPPHQFKACWARMVLDLRMSTNSHEQRLFQQQKYTDLVCHTRHDGCSFPCVKLGNVQQRFVRRLVLLRDQSVHPIPDDVDRPLPNWCWWRHVSPLEWLLERLGKGIAEGLVQVVEIVDACAHINLFDLGRAGAQQSSVAHAKAAVVLQRRPWLRVHSVS